MCLSFLPSFEAAFVWNETGFSLSSLTFAFTLWLTLPETSTGELPCHPHIGSVVKHPEGVLELHEESYFAISVVFNPVPCGSIHFTLINDAK